MKHFLFSLFLGLLSVVQMHAATSTFVYDDTKTEKENGTALQAAMYAACQLLNISISDTPADPIYGAD